MESDSEIEKVRKSQWVLSCCSNLLTGVLIRPHKRAWDIQKTSYWWVKSSLNQEDSRNKKTVLEDEEGRSRKNSTVCNIHWRNNGLTWIYGEVQGSVGWLEEDSSKSAHDPIKGACFWWWPQKSRPMVVSQQK